MFIRQFDRISISTILMFVFLLVLYAICEHIDSYYTNLIQSIVKKTTFVDPYNMTNITGYVYFSIKNAHYPYVYDDYLNFSVYGAVVRRMVQYCQYQAVNNSKDFFLLSDIETYSRKWVSRYIDSSNFLDKNYINPPLKVSVNETYLYNDIKIGNITVPSNFYPSDVLFYYFEPDELDIANFSYSKASSNFEFIKNGYFYHSSVNKSSKKQINKIQNEIRSQIYDKKNLYYESQNIFFKRCHSGDVRIKYYLYAPLNVTYFGYLDNYTLSAKMVKKKFFGTNKLRFGSFEMNFGKIRLGTTKRGNLAKWSLESLVSQYIPKKGDDTLMDLFSCPRVYSKITIFFYILTFTSLHFDGQQLKSSYWVVACAFANLAYRSIFWDVWYLDFKMWTVILMAHLTVGYLLGVWTFPNQLNRQNGNHQNEENQDQNRQNLNENNQNQNEENQDQNRQNLNENNQIQNEENQDQNRQNLNENNQNQNEENQDQNRQNLNENNQIQNEENQNFM